MRAAFEEGSAASSRALFGRKASATLMGNDMMMDVDDDVDDDVDVDVYVGWSEVR
jgi:hypothetical protein